MKKLALLSALILLSTFAFSQDNDSTATKENQSYSDRIPSAGSVLVEARVGFSTFQQKGQTDDTEYRFTLDLGTSGQYFLDQNWSVGLGLGFSTRTSVRSSDFFANEVTSTSKSFSIGPVARYTFDPIKETLQPFLQLDMPYEYRHTESSTGDLTDNNPPSHSYALNFRGGIIFFPLDFLGIQLTGSALRFQSTFRELDGEKHTENILDLDLMRKNWQLGVCFVF
ncbi:outer membrane beta-barrel protein [Halocola ammonii]